MRITKEPEERKQEILDTAMRLFYEKGYEKTSITDIAKAIGVAPGIVLPIFSVKRSPFQQCHRPVCRGTCAPFFYSGG